MDYAEQLIKQRRYAEANVILNQVGSNARSRKLMKQILRETGQRPKMSSTAKSLIGCAALVMVCIGLSCMTFLGQEVGILPNPRETKTAQALEKTDIRLATEVVLALTPSITPTPSKTPVPSNTPTVTLTPSITLTASLTYTPSMTSTQSPADRAAQVVRNLRDTDIGDNDLRDSTSDFEDRAVVRIYLRGSEESEAAAIRQVRKDFARLACDLRKAGFVDRIAMTGTANFSNGQELKAIEIILERGTIGALDCDHIGQVDLFAIADDVYLHPSIAVNWTPTPGSRAQSTPAGTSTTSDNRVSETRYTTENINVRNGPGTDFDRVGSLPAGAAVGVTGEQDGWYQIEFAGGVGWILGEYTTATRPVSPNAAATLNISTGGTCPNTCQQITSCEQAYACLQAGYDDFDRDHDGVPCENICPGG